MTTNRDNNVIKGKPFFFDVNVFDEQAIARKEAEEKNLPKFEYTKEQLEQTRKAAYAEGKKAGSAEAQTSLSQSILQVVQKMDRNLTMLFASEEERNTRYEQETIALVHAIVKTIFPIYFQNHGLEELKHSIAQAITEQKNIPCIDVEVHESVASEIETYVKQVEADTGTKLSIRASKSVPPNHCHMVWQNGGVVLAKEKIAQHVLSLLQQTLAEQGISIHDDNSGHLL